VGSVSAKHAVIWENGVPRNLGDLGGHSWNTPTAINNDGLIGGFSLPADQDGTRNFLPVVWTSSGIKKLTAFTGTIRGQVTGINGDGKIVGFERVTGLGPRAVVWQNADAVVQDLNSFVPPGSSTLIISGDVNNAGEIAGYTADGFGFKATPK
jgi:uncharacterized membrane protein